MNSVEVINLEVTLIEDADYTIRRTHRGTWEVHDRKSGALLEEFTDAIAAARWTRARLIDRAGVTPELDRGDEI